MVMLHYNGREHGHVTEEVASLKEGMVMLQRWSV